VQAKQYKELDYENNENGTIDHPSRKGFDHGCGNDSGCSVYCNDKTVM